MNRSTTNVLARGEVGRTLQSDILSQSIGYIKYLENKPSSLVKSALEYESLLTEQRTTILSLFRPLSGAQVKYRKNTDKKWAKIQKNTEKIQKNSLKYRTFGIFLKEMSCIRDFLKSVLDNLHHNISVHIYDSKISVIASNYSFIHRSSEPPNKVRGTKNIIEENRGANIWETQKNTECFPNYRNIQKNF